MAQIKIYIDSKLVDLPVGELNLNMTFGLKSREGLNINTGSRSEYSFEFPSTHANDLIFSRFYDLGESTSSKQVFLNAYIEVDGLPFFTGIARLTSVTTTADLYYWKGKTWKVSFYGNNVDWVQRLKDKYLYQYNYGTSTFDYFDILNGYNNTYSGGDAFKYILIKWKDWLNSFYVTPFESTFALFIKAIVDRIFADIGYTIVSNFMSLASFEKLVLPIPLGEKITDPQFSIDYLSVDANDPVVTSYSTSLFVTVNTLSNQSTAPLIGANPYNTATSEYTIPVTGYYLLKIWGNWVVSFPVGIGFYFKQNGVTVPNSIISPSYFAPFYSENETVIFANAGDIITVEGLALSGGIDTSDVQLFISISGEPALTQGAIIDPFYLINKSWNSLDFIKGLAHAFNLTFQTDVNARTVTIEPANNYINQSSYPVVNNLENGFYSGVSTDLTDAVDMIKEGEVYNRSEISQQVRLSWQVDSNDPTIEALNQNADLGVHQSRFNFISNRFNREEEVIENPFFSSTICLEDITIKSANSLVNPIVPIIWAENYLETPVSSEPNYDIVPRILTSERNAFGDNGIINMETSPGIIADFSCPYSYMVDYNTLSGNFLSLSFASETVNGFYVKGLLERFYLYDFIRKQSGKEVECFIFWDTLQITNLDFRKLVKIHGDNFILQEINMFSVTSNVSTKTYLVYDEKGNGTEVNQIQNTLLSSKIID
jgi:hypothetical protein